MRTEFNQYEKVAWATFVACGASYLTRIDEGVREPDEFVGYPVEVPKFITTFPPFRKDAKKLDEVLNLIFVQGLQTWLQQTRDTVFDSDDELVGIVDRMSNIAKTAFAEGKDPEEIEKELQEEFDA